MTGARVEPDMFGIQEAGSEEVHRRQRVRNKINTMRKGERRKERRKEGRKNRGRREARKKQ